MGYWAVLGTDLVDESQVPSKNLGLEKVESMNVRRLFLCAMLVVCLALIEPAWAGIVQITDTDLYRQETLKFNVSLAGDVCEERLTSGSFSALGPQVRDFGTFAGPLSISSTPRFGPASGPDNGLGGDDGITISLQGNCSPTSSKCSGLVAPQAVSLQTLPEPATLSVLGVGLLALGTGLKKKVLLT